MYLESHLEKPLKVCTILNENTHPFGVGLTTHAFTVSMKKAKYTNNVLITGEWKKAVKEFDLQEGQVILFNIHEACYGGLRMNLFKLPVN